MQSLKEDFLNQVNRGGLFKPSDLCYISSLHKVIYKRSWTNQPGKKCLCIWITFNIFLLQWRHLLKGMTPKPLCKRNNTFKDITFLLFLQEWKYSAQHFLKNLCYDDASILQTARKRCDGASSSFSGPSKRKITKLQSKIAWYWTQNCSHVETNHNKHVSFTVFHLLCWDLLHFMMKSHT